MYEREISIFHVLCVRTPHHCTLMPLKYYSSSIRYSNAIEVEPFCTSSIAFHSFIFSCANLFAHSTFTHPKTKSPVAFQRFKQETY